ncbi:uncharacterized protein LOC116259936 [Nymphaea colorata]|uniref:uncharacterized protein LOC116259936 n=1 Tax=Nymphaea colorata TaxID=210225 RepID=UPI00129DA888|nr:uncharacterized protein LOC116259936 [Nymphaea colorata]XP_031493811.1 uncharacterized protein LOC116259936 [Nymphaea colorata]
MICPASRSNSRLNWLDRLRTSKGFPVGNEIGLEAFLDANAPPSGQVESSGDDRSAASARPDISGESAKVRVRMKRGRGPIGRDKEDWFAILNGMLAELFNMGDPRRSRVMDERRTSRKQKNPKTCTILCSANGGDRNAAVSPQTSVSGTKDKETVEMNSVHRRPRRKSGKNGLKVDEKEEGSANVLPAEDSCSCTVVTVIDSSFPGWKFGKAISRKGNDWRIREIRKSLDGNMATSESIFRKKRRLNCGKDHDEPPICSWIASGEGGTVEAAQDIRTSE